MNKYLDIKKYSTIPLDFIILGYYCYHRHNGINICVYCDGFIVKYSDVIQIYVSKCFNHYYTHMSQEESSLDQTEVLTSLLM